MGLHWITIIIMIIAFLIIAGIITTNLLKRKIEKEKISSRERRKSVIGFSRISKRDSESLMSRYENDKTGVDDLYDVLSQNKTYLFNDNSLTERSNIEYTERIRARESRNLGDSFIRKRFEGDFADGREPFAYDYDD